MRGGIFEPTSGNVEGLVSQFTSELARQSRRPPSNDNVIGAMCLAALHALENEGPLLQAVTDLVAARAHEPTSQQVGDFRAVIQNDVLDENPEFPNGDAYHTPRAWQEPLKDLGERYVGTSFASAELEERSERLSYNLLFRKVQTDVPERALPVEYVMQTRRERFAEGVRWLDVGCGIMEGQSFLHNKTRFGLPAVTVEDFSGTVDTRATHQLQKIFEQNSILSSSVGLDLADAYDPNTFLWSRGSLRPAELSNRQFLERFVAIAEERLAFKDPGYPANFVRGDVMSDGDITEVRSHVSGQKFDIVSIRTMAHQLDQRERSELLERAVSLTTDTGLVVLSDFTRLRSKRQITPKHLSFYKHWHLPFRYRSFILDMAEPEHGFKEILRAKNSRCDTFQIVDEQFWSGVSRDSD